MGRDAVSTIASKSSRSARAGLLLATGLLASGGLIANTQITAGVTGTGSISYTETAGNDGQWSTGLGTGFDAGITHERGPHTLGAGYNTSLDHRWGPEYRNQLTIGGNTRYGYRERAGRFDFNARHNASTTTRQGLIWLDPNQYTWRQTVNAGGGINFRPSARLTARFASRGGATFFQDSDQNGQTWSNSVTLTRTLSERDTLSGTLDRTLTFSGSTEPDAVIDSGRLTYNRRLETGSLMLSAGLTETRAETMTALTGTWSARRIWTRQNSQSMLGYNRVITNTLLELTLEEDTAMDEGIPESELADAEIGESLLIIGLGIRDEVQASHRTDRVCAVCTLTVRGSVAQNEGMFTGELTYDYGAGATFGVALDTLSTVSLGYGYQSESEDLFGTVVQTAQRLNLDWNRQLADATTVTAGISHAWNRGETNRFRSEARVALRHGLI